MFIKFVKDGEYSVLRIVDGKEVKTIHKVPLSAYMNTAKVVMLHSPKGYLNIHLVDGGIIPLIKRDRVSFHGDVVIEYEQPRVNPKDEADSSESTTNKDVRKGKLPKV